MSDANWREIEHGTTPTIWIQWKGTDVCFDFWCECSDPESNCDFGHADFDAPAPYAVQCARCGRKYDLPQTLPLLPYSGEWEAKPVDGYEEDF